MHYLMDRVMTEEEQKNNSEVVKLLLEAGGDVDAKDRYGLTPLDYANGARGLRPRGKIANLLQAAMAPLLAPKLLGNESGYPYRKPTGTK